MPRPMACVANCDEVCEWFVEDSFVGEVVDVEVVAGAAVLACVLVAGAYAGAQMPPLWRLKIVKVLNTGHTLRIIL